MVDDLKCKVSGDVKLLVDHITYLVKLLDRGRIEISRTDHGSMATIYICKKIVIEPLGESHMRKQRVAFFDGHVEDIHCGSFVKACVSAAYRRLSDGRGTYSELAYITDSRLRNIVVELFDCGFILCKKIKQDIMNQNIVALKGSPCVCRIIGTSGDFYRGRVCGYSGHELNCNNGNPLSNAPFTNPIRNGQTIKCTRVDIDNG